VNDLICLLDLDGTAVDSHNQISQAVCEARSFLGLPDLTEGYLREVIGLSASLLFPELEADSQASQDSVNLFRSLLREICSQGNVLFPGVIETVTMMKSNGTKVGVATNKPQELAELVVKNSQLFGLVDIVCGSHGSDQKPKPDILLRCLADTGAKRGLMFGDRPEDMSAAKAAGILGYGLALGSFSRESLLEAGAEEAFEVWDDVRSYLESRGEYWGFS